MSSWDEIDAAREAAMIVRSDKRAAPSRAGRGRRRRRATRIHRLSARTRTNGALRVLIEGLVEASHKGRGRTVTRCRLAAEALARFSTSRSFDAID